MKKSSIIKRIIKLEQEYIITRDTKIRYEIANLIKLYLK